MTLHDVLGFAVLVLILAGSFALMGLLLTWAQLITASLRQISLVSDL
jgi:hypothetical protein